MTKETFNNFMEQYEELRERIITILNQLQIWANEFKNVKKKIFPEYWIHGYHYDIESKCIGVELISNRKVEHELWIHIPCHFMYEDYTEQDLISLGEKEMDINY